MRQKSKMIAAYLREYIETKHFIVESSPVWACARILLTSYSKSQQLLAVTISIEVLQVIINFDEFFEI